MLYIEHLTKTYGDKKAVDDLSLHIAPGEIYGFIGHNGAGKTTTLKAVGGILAYDTGEITVGGISQKRDPLACKKQIAYIPDNPDLYDFMSGIKYLHFIADVFGVLTVNVPDDSEWFGWCSFDPYFDTLNVVACATGALENLCISDERVILNRSRAA